MHLFKKTSRPLVSQENEGIILFLIFLIAKELFLFGIDLNVFRYFFAGRFPFLACGYWTAVCRWQFNWVMLGL